MILPSLYYQQHPASDARDLIHRYETREFQSPFRSTIPLLALIKDAGSALESLLEPLGVGTNPKFVFEHQVETRGGRGKPSHTDLMITSGDRAWAVEAKWTEPRYSTVKEWIAESERAGKPDEAQLKRKNREAVANGWLEYIRARGAAAPDLEACNQVVYQMLHRAASACATGNKPALVYLVFAQATAELPHFEFYANDLKAFHALLGHPSAFPFYLAYVPFKETDAFAAIKTLQKGTPETAAEVLQALSTTRLFTFAEPEVSVIGS
jgi:hypothetical protein